MGGRESCDNADDASFIVKANEYSINNLVGIMNKFGLASRLESNRTKNVPY